MHCTHHTNTHAQTHTVRHVPAARHARSVGTGNRALSSGPNLTYVNVWLCVYICVYVYVYIDTHTHTHTHTHTRTHTHTLTHSLTHARHQAQTRPHSRRPCCGAQTSSTGFGVEGLGLGGCVLGCYRPRTWRPCCGAQISVPGTTRLCPAAPPASCPPSQPSLSLVTEASRLIGRVCRTPLRERAHRPPVPTA